ncbi:MAG: Uma2 family endonuclease [Anaerolineae bacterium]
MSVQERVGMPMNEFIRQFDEAPFELIDGERIVIVPTVLKHGLVLKLIYSLLLGYEQAHPDVAEVFSELPFVLTYTSDWVSGSRIPDIMAFNAERLAAYRAQTPDFEDKPFVLVADLCVEIISANDNYADVEAKVDRYLSDGVRLVWVVDPYNRTVAVYAPGSDQITRLSGDATLSGGDLLPGFALPLKDIFPG